VLVCIEMICCSGSRLEFAISYFCLHCWVQRSDHCPSL